MKKGSYFYLLTQKKLLDTSDERKEFKLNEARQVFLFLRIPKKVTGIILKEMEEMNLIKKINGRRFQIINCDSPKIIEEVC